MADVLKEALLKIRKRVKESSLQKTSSAVCSKCGDTGRIVYENEDGILLARNCDCGIWERMIQESRLKFASIPKAYETVRITDLKEDVYKSDHSREQMRQVLKAVRYYLSNYDEMKERGMGLYLYSAKKGNGKTMTASAIANELIDMKHSVKFATSTMILNEIKASWDRESNTTESNLLHQLSTTEILVIDDFGTESVRDWITERFYEIVNNRYCNKLVTIFTSNYPLSDIKYDERITNRIKEMVFPIPYPDESVRESILKKNMNELIGMIRNG